MQLTNDAEQVQPLALSPSGEVNLERFAQLLAMRGHHVWLRTGRLESCSGHVALRHTFVLAGVSGGCSESLLGADNRLADACAATDCRGNENQQLQQSAAPALTHSCPLLPLLLLLSFRRLLRLLHSSSTRQPDAPALCCRPLLQGAVPIAQCHT